MPAWAGRDFPERIRALNPRTETADMTVEPMRLTSLVEVLLGLRA
jgi:hypothetical protein